LRTIIFALLFSQQLLAAGHFKILQINDVYKFEGLENGATGGLARIRTLRKQLERDGTPVLVLHAGDLLYPSVMSKYLAARPMIETLNVLDGDAAAFDSRLIITLGNHEFEKDDPLFLLGRLAQSDFRWVSSNTWYCRAAGSCMETFATRVPATVRDTIVIDAGGVLVGIFGLTVDTPGTWFRIDHKNKSDRFAATRAAIDKLKKDGAKVIVGLTHEDMSDDLDLAASFPDIDLIVGGHDHLYQEKQVGHAWVAKADADARSAIVWDVTVPDSGAVSSNPVKVMIDATIEKDAAVDATVQQWLAALAKQLGPNDTIGMTKNLLEGVEPAVRGHETALGNLLTDVARDWMKADVGLLNGGAIRINDNIPPGPIRKYDMEGVFYYPGTLVDFELTGQQLLDMLRNGVSRVDAGDGRFLQVSGIKFTYRGGPPFTVDAKDVFVKGAPLDLAKKYKVATVQYIYENGAGDGFTLFEKATRPPLLHPIDAKANDHRAATEKTIAALPGKMVTTAVEGRIVKGE